MDTVESEQHLLSFPVIVKRIRDTDDHIEFVLGVAEVLDQKLAQSGFERASGDVAVCKCCSRNNSRRAWAGGTSRA